MINTYFPYLEVTKKMNQNSGTVDRTQENIFNFATMMCWVYKGFWLMISCPMAVYSFSSQSKYNWPLFAGLTPPTRASVLNRTIYRLLCVSSVWVVAQLHNTHLGVARSALPQSRSIVTRRTTRAAGTQIFFPVRTHSLLFRFLLGFPGSQQAA